MDYLSSEEYDLMFNDEYELWLLNQNKKKLKMKTFNEIYQEFISHPEFIYGEIIDKETIVDQVFDIIGDLTDYNMEQHIIDELCENLFENNKEDIKKNFNKYFEMGEKYYYLSSNPVHNWLLTQENFNNFFKSK